MSREENANLQEETRAEICDRILTVLYFTQQKQTI
jgi:hypothetical protein